MAATPACGSASTLTPEAFRRRGRSSVIVTGIAVVPTPRRDRRRRCGVSAVVGLAPADSGRRGRATSTSSYALRVAATAP